MLPIVLAEINTPTFHRLQKKMAESIDLSKIIISNGMHYIRLDVNPKLSRKYDKTGWAIVRNPTNGTLLLAPRDGITEMKSIYSIPDVLKGAPMRALMQAHETRSKKTGAAYIVSGYSGEMMPFDERIESKEDPGHPRAIVFRKEALAVIEAVNDYKTGETTLPTIQRHSVEVRNGVVVQTSTTIIVEDKIRTIKPASKKTSFRRIRDEYWDDAIEAINRKKSCTTRGCEGHYYRVA